MSKHTPGPWIAVFNCDKDDGLNPPQFSEIFTSDRTAIIATADCHCDEDRWNFHLMAAAPEMLEELKRWVGSCSECYPGPPSIDCELCGQTAIVIAKAEGRWK